jgi:hypothetical protein
MQDGRTPQEQMPNIRVVHGNMYSKSVTTWRIMVRNMQETRSRPLSLHNDVEILDNPKKFILHLLQVNGPRRQRLQNYGADVGDNIRCI